MRFTLLSLFVYLVGASALALPRRSLDRNDGIHLAVSPKCGSLSGSTSDANAGIELGRYKTIVSFGVRSQVLQHDYSSRCWHVICPIERTRTLMVVGSTMVHPLHQPSLTHRIQKLVEDLQMESFGLNILPMITVLSSWTTQYVSSLFESACRLTVELVL